MMKTELYLGVFCMGMGIGALLGRHLDDPVLHTDCLSLVDRCERMAAVRGWKLEPDDHA